LDGFLAARNTAGNPVASDNVIADPGLIDGLSKIVVAAAAAIRHCRRDSGLRIKADGSPVTKADETAESIIRDGLAKLAPAMPVISEEQPERERPAVAGSRYFLVDPLDGTRDFVDGRDEYTVNIGLIADGQPVVGVIAAPALGVLWRGVVGWGAERLTFDAGRMSPPAAIRTRPFPANDPVVMVSRSHLEAGTQAYLDRLPRAHRIACGSSLKFCRLAEGAADLYPRLGPTRDWDVAAGHAVLVAAGGSVQTPEGNPLVYGTTDLRIPAFVAFGSRAPDERLHATLAGKPLKG
jgi:3'(2'), 5'-bisphosphate nucleotidase